MNIFVPYTDIQPITKFCLKDYDGHYKLVKVGDAEEYFNYFKDRWAEGKQFINLEQDIAFWPGALEAIWNCPANWCTYGYDLIGVINHPNAIPPLGLTKFSEIFIDQTRDMWDELPSRHWTNLDSGINNWVKSKEFLLGVHLHYPSVINYHPEVVQT